MKFIHLENIYECQPLFTKKMESMISDDKYPKT